MKNLWGKLPAVLFLTALFAATAPEVSAVVCADSVAVLFLFKGGDTASNVGTTLLGLGDVNGDGHPDLAVSSNSPQGVYVFFGGPGADNLPDMFYPHDVKPVASIDLDGDGIDDFVAVGLGGILHFYRGYGDSIATTPYDSFNLAPYTFWPTGFAFGHVDSNKYPDMLAERGDSVQGPILCYIPDFPTLNRSIKWSYAINGAKWQLSKFGFIDFNGDGHMDIWACLSVTADTSGYVYIFLGPNFGAKPDVVIGPPLGFDTLGAGWRNPKMAFALKAYSVGDFDGDGWNDLVISYNETPFLYRFGPGADTLYDYVLERYCISMVGAGDINGDGKNDLVAGETRPPWGGIDVYLGGPRADSYSDYCVNSYALPPLELDAIGRTVTRIGDWNGDGYDDICFSTTHLDGVSCCPGYVLIIPGSTNIKTGITELVEDRPVDLNVFPNFPNPFNPSTTISFDLPKRETVKLTVYDITGRTVRTLLNKPLAAGTFKVQWDGTNQSGQSVASGVYLFTLSTPDFQKTIKGTLLK